MLLDRIRTPRDLKGWSLEQLRELAAEVRVFLIDNLARTGGHVGSNLGVVELTIALHRVFDAENDRFLFDGGHQGLTHKLLTGRRDIFPTLNAPGGMSRYLSPAESPYDILGSGHGGTAVSIGTGLAQAMLHDNKQGLVVAVVGDSSFAAGMNFEALNFAGDQPLPLVVVINDNGMSVSPSVGGLRHLFADADWERKCEAWFTGLGFRYQAVPDGHDLEDLVLNFSKARQLAPDGPVVVHVKTEKGRGLPAAADHPQRLHLSAPFNPLTGRPLVPAPAGQPYAAVVGKTLDRLLTADPNVYVVTPATGHVSGLDSVMAAHPGRVIDAGLAEQQAVGLAAGLALGGKRVFLCIQDSSLPRAFDQLVRDVAQLNLPVTIIAGGSGFAGLDNATLHNLGDLAWLPTVPNLSVFFAGTSRDLAAVIEARARDAEGPLVVLHAQEPVWSGERDQLPAEPTPLEQPEILSEGTDGLILAMGNRLAAGVRLRDALRRDFGADFALVNPRWLQPLPVGMLAARLRTGIGIVTLEEGRDRGGFGAAIAQYLADQGLKNPLHISAVRGDCVPAGSKDVLSAACGIDAESIIKELRGRGFPLKRS